MTKWEHLVLSIRCECGVSILYCVNTQLLIQSDWYVPAWVWGRITGLCIEERCDERTYPTTTMAFAIVICDGIKMSHSIVTACNVLG
jgi:hypothetical protein